MNRFAESFITGFYLDGTIDRQRLVKFNSASG